MKKLILSVLFASVSGICLAQISFGVQLGANMGMGKFKYSEESFQGYDSHTQKNKAKVGFLGGFIVDIPLSGPLSFSPELNFIQEGTKNTTTGIDGVYSFVEEQKITLNYIQLPLNIVYKMPVGPGSVFFGLGPSLNLGISGKNKYKFSSTFDPEDSEEFKVKFDGKKSDDLDPDDNDDHLKRVDVGINVMAGYKLGMGVFIKLAYNHGFMDINPNKNNEDPQDRSKYKNSGFRVGIGYMFGGGGKKK